MFLVPEGEAGRIASNGLASSPGRIREPPIDAARTVDLLREAEEWAEARTVVPSLSRGDLLLMDGALHTESRTREPLLAECSARGVVAIGVAKRTSASHAGVPLLLAALGEGSRQVPGRAFACEVTSIVREPGVRSFAALLEPGAGRCFRIDFDARIPDPRAALSALAGLSLDPGYPGYPWPLAAAHNAVAFSEHEKQDLAHRLRAEAIERGVSDSDWDACFEDFHERLDRGR